MGENLLKKEIGIIWDMRTSLESNLITTFIKHLYSPSLIGITTDNM